jgi:hypothetical protein
MYIQSPILIEVITLSAMALWLITNLFLELKEVSGDH